ncbi:tripartite tricarboxylate transporter substrate binding protein [Brevibacterium sp. SMBL_HHYL_HB1]|uniref:Bug family tripartite tricarboxylate transporter substrate binding protein n=1 Tax=Brevibacterium sp. SMBL_HHYL_HB1 TaxID=2777556 RepID=UPI001BACF964|nr:tripartite tricarboxylate transporter substrate binding protein [Brevibacterium sp. SMBL_HHYL_HB1]QUL78817.1 tripartite tricarboxylate transporter substrate binding protein [Brevibacterium sp. SMBL_HHYL_HB1]
MYPNSSRSRRLCSLAAGVAGLSLLFAACGGGQTGSADSYPNKSIEMIVPWSAGGDTDAIFRMIGDGLKEELGADVVIKNVPGGGGSVGAQQAMAANNDGYTLLAGHDSIAISHISGETDFGYFDFEPISLMTSSYDYVATAADSSWDDMDDMIKDAKANPGEISYGASIGSTSQLEPALIQAVADVEFNIVGQKDTAERMQAVVGGHVDLGGVSVVAAKEYLDADKMKLLGYMAPERDDALPDVPTLKEQGIDAASATNRGLFAPEGTPEEIVDKVDDALAEVAEDQEFVDTLTDLGTDVNYKNTDEYETWLKDNQEEMQDAMEKAGMVD